MNIKSFLALFLVFFSTVAISFAQSGESYNPYAIFGGNPYIAGAERDSARVDVFVIESVADSSPVGRLEHNTRTGIVRLFDTEGNLVAEKQLRSGERAWPVIDPLVEKRMWLSPYNFCSNNPVNRTDPTGMLDNDYRYDFKTGTFHLMAETNDRFDRVLGYNYNKTTDKWQQNTGLFSTKVYMDDIEKGILSDGINFRDNDNIWEIGSDGQPTVEGFQNFAIGFADMIRKEVAGFYFSQQYQNDVSYIYMGRYINNTRTESKTGSGPYNLRPELIGTIQPHTSWHTHPSDFPDASRLVPSGLNDGRGDIGFKRNQSANGFKYFIILTGGHPPIHY